MMQIDLERLRSMGLTASLAQAALHQATQWVAQSAGQSAEAQPPDNAAHQVHLMRLTEVHRETLHLHDGDAERSARALPRLTRSLADAGDALAVGDWVLATVTAHHQCWVHQRLPPHTQLVRRDADGRRHTVVSNADHALLVMGLDDDFNLRRLERFVALVHGSGVRPAVVLTKADTVDGARALFVRQQAVRSRLPPGLALWCVDARDPDTAARLTPLASPGQTLVLLGSSGAGKSTLTNTLLGHGAQDTGAVRTHDSRGKHTTTARSLYRLPGGACIIDTPGLRALRPDADAQAVAATFTDIGGLAAMCRFRDCRHQNEPGCGVRAAVDEDRLQNFHKLLHEAERDSQGPLARRHQLALWKARTRAGRERARSKRGDPP